MHESNLTWVTLEVGKSIEQRPIIAHRFHSNRRPPVLIFGSIHGDEAEAHELCRLLEERWTSDLESFERTPCALCSVGQSRWCRFENPTQCPEGGLQP